MADQVKAQVKPALDSLSGLLCSISKLEHLTYSPVEEVHPSIPFQLRNGINYPCQRACAKVNAFLADVPESLARYDQAIADVKRLLIGLETARNSLQRRSDDAKSLIAPIRKLPSDILNEVFIFYCWKNRGGSGDFDASSLWPALKLSWVCSFWRTLVHSHQKLWSSLQLSSQMLQFYPKRFQIFLKSISYSGNHLLDIDYRGDYYDGPGSEVDNAIGVLLDNSMRWRRATITLLSWPEAHQDWLSYVIDRQSSRVSEPKQLGNFSALEYLSIRGRLSMTRSDKLSDFFRIFSLCPRLTTFHFDGSLSLSGLNLDLSHITDLALGTFIGKSLAHLLCRLPALEILKVGGFCFSEDRPTDILLQGKRHYSSALSKLVVLSSTAFQPEAWNSLRLPCLNSLETECHDIPHLRSVILDSQAELQTLHVHHVSTQTEQSLLDFLAFHRFIVDLTLNFERATDVEFFVHYLEPKADGSRIVPNLRSLKVSGMHWRPLFPFQQASHLSVCLSIVRLIESRCTVIRSPAGPLGISGLQSLTLVVSKPEFRRHFSTFFRIHFRQLEEAGLIVDVQIS
ncbi:hypothetical protein BT96DRAFT_1020539 [Gymnopus androsaceus JB14]|uniref:F-box domain-containing protein n=1 Tax=Gymnopus androsaceus JB14 TaxID=1447944 RepID=A0A6A4HJL2_9AGAR|nr:hypothetical protein BT96DRAFT_1020539 [Gymnopus androsaceus JB14]